MTEHERRVLLSREEIEAGLADLADRLRPRLEGSELTVIPIMGGAMIFAADLIRQLPPGLILDFLRIQTYGDATSPQIEPEVEWRPNPANVKGRTVLLLDDILDTGRTMQEARRFLIEECGATEVLCVVLVDKPARRAVEITADDRVLHLEEDLFLVGCGLDWAGKYRNLPELCFIEQSDKA
ncbi:MAG: hypoxanthine phosphoribosyltransferase [Planctomycetes bacterium]|nr:hypoxanthine phosphoribosyltransferase [Planctomycetota bacterium]